MLQGCYIFLPNLKILYLSGDIESFLHLNIPFRRLFLPRISNRDWCVAIPNRKFCEASWWVFFRAETESESQKEMSGSIEIPLRDTDEVRFS